MTRILALTSVLSLFSGFANSAPIIFDFTATVTGASGTNAVEVEAATGLDLSAFDIGDMFSGQVIIDLANAGVNPASTSFATPLSPSAHRCFSKL